MPSREAMEELNEEVIRDMYRTWTASTDTTYGTMNYIHVPEVSEIIVDDTEGLSRPRRYPGAHLRMTRKHRKAALEKDMPFRGASRSNKISDAELKLLDDMKK